MRIVLFALTITACSSIRMHREGSINVADVENTVEIDAAMENVGHGGRVNVSTGEHTIHSPVWMPAGRTLHLSAGHYVCATPIDKPCFILSDQDTLLGDGWATVIDDPPSFVVIATANNTAPNYGGWRGNEYLSIKDFLIRGSDTGTGPTNQSTIALGNALHVAISGVAFVGSRAYSIETGESSDLGNHAADVDISSCLFAGKSWALAIVNADRVRLFDSALEGPGVDVEPNTLSDLASQFEISGCSGLSAVVQGANTGPGKIDGNFGSAILLAGTHDIAVTNNYLSAGPGQNGIWAGGAKRAQISGNHIIDSGWPILSGPFAIVLGTLPASDGTFIPTTDSAVFDNTAASSQGFVGSATIAEYQWTAEAPKPDHNSIFDNVLGPGAFGTSGAVIILGDSSVSWGNRIIDR